MKQRIQKNLLSTLPQILNNILEITESGVATTLKNPPLWRDVCIFNPDLITFRSLTNDKTFKPKILIPDSINWVMSNDMPYISNHIKL